MELTTPVEIDTALAATYEALAKIDRDLSFAAHRALNLADAKFYYRGKSRVTDMTLREAEGILAEKVEAGGFRAHDSAEALAKLAELRTAREAVIVEMEKLNDLYTGWSRFFLVTSSAGGHIHSSMDCSTCRISTEYGWLPTLSGLTEEAAVAAHGAILCTVCYPSAPVEWTGGISNTEQAAKDERAAAKAQRDADKAAKAITAADGSPLKTQSFGTIRTLVTAQRELIGMLENKIGYSTDRYDADIEMVAEAISAKTGESKAELLSAANAKAAKKAAKWGA